MANRVAILDDMVANQIAAGEVVERPASVVKELVENALDANATTIYVEVIDGGRALIRVVDDGDGMPRKDAELAVQRHATSKIRSADDLSEIETLGFRGEALPSIASVSRFSMVTRNEASAVATRVVIEGDADPNVRDDSGPVGTRIEVRDLFFAVPARLKFLKRASTEIRHISSLITRFALGHPHVHFRLTHNERKMLDVPRAPSLKQRIYQLLGKDVVAHLLEIESLGAIRVRGFLTSPSSTRGNRTALHTFVNGRAVDDKVVLHGVQAAYGELLPRGRYPVGVLYVHLPPEDVDVNVHPAKAEVRFVRSGDVHQAIARAIRASLTAYVTSSPVGAYMPSTPPSSSVYPRSPRPAPNHVPPSPGEWDRVARQGVVRKQQALTFVSKPTALPQAPATRTSSPNLAQSRLTGQTERGYLLCEDAGGLTIVHLEHALAHVARRRARKALSEGDGLPTQTLLMPLNIELPVSLTQRLQRRISLLRRAGMHVEHFGGHTWQIIGVPATMGSADPAALLRLMLESLAVCDGQAAASDAGLSALADTIAAETRPRHTGTLSEAQVTRLLSDLDDVGERNPGEPRFAARLSWEELDNRFRRRG